MKREKQVTIQTNEGKYIQYENTIHLQTLVWAEGGINLSKKEVIFNSRQFVMFIFLEICDTSDYYK